MHLGAPLRRFAFLCLSLFLAGCSITPTASPLIETGATLHGKVHGGQQPIVGAHIYLFAANTTGYGNASVSLLNAAVTLTSDSVGAYVLTDANGNFTITGDYACTANTQVYLYALGGNPGAGTNSASGLLAILGNCPASTNFATTIPTIWINEVSTVAAAYAFAGFATDATHVSSSGTTLAKTGIANAFANAASVASISTGAALATTPGGNGTPPQSKINTLANILASCVNSTGPASTQCSALFSNDLSAGSTGTTATDTASAAINLAHNPGNAVATLFALQSGVASPFAPALASAPNDFAVPITFTAGLSSPFGIAIDKSGFVWVSNSDFNTLVRFQPNGAVASGSPFSGGGLNIPQGVSVDPSGNIWVANTGVNSLSEFTASGTAISSTSGYTGGGLFAPWLAAFDTAGNAWVTNAASRVSKFSSAGAAITSSSGYTGGGINNTQGIAVDASGNVWISNTLGGALTELAPTGTPISSTGYTGGGINVPFSVAIDSGGNVWLANYTGSSLSKFSSTGTAISGASGFTGGGIFGPATVAVDGLSIIWTSNLKANPSRISEFTNLGVAVSPSTGFLTGTLGHSQDVRPDGSGNVWSLNDNNTITLFLGIATPVSTPILPTTLGSRP